MVGFSFFSVIDRHYRKGIDGMLLVGCKKISLYFGIAWRVITQKNNVIVKVGKRGRKRKGYFYEDQEQAVVDYIRSDNQAQRNRIFNEWLRPAFTKMIESIIRRYKLRPPDEEFEDTFNDTISFLMMKIEKFDPDKGFKAYSYCGTICKNYLMWKINNFKNIQQREEEFVDSYGSSSKGGLVNSNHAGESPEENFLTMLIGNVCTEIRRIIDDKENSQLTPNEEVVGMALINLFENWEELEQELGSNKFNKSAILLYLKELTRLDTPTIRNSMKKYKTAYYDIKKLMLQS